MAFQEKKSAIDLGVRYIGHKHN